MAIRSFRSWQERANQFDLFWIRDSRASWPSSVLRGLSMANLSITQGQLEQLADMLAERLSKQRRCVDKSELAERLGISVSTVERLMAEKKIPFIKPNRRVLFDIEAVITALSSSRE